MIQHARHFTCKNTFNPYYNSMEKVLLSFPFNRLGNESGRRASTLPRSLPTKWIQRKVAGPESVLLSPGPATRQP